MPAHPPETARTQFSTCRRFAVAASTLTLLLSAACTAADLPTPLDLTDAIDSALRQRGEVDAAQAAVDAARERPAIAGALDDPMIMAGIDHYPYRAMSSSMASGSDGMPVGPGGRRYDSSVQIEQQFPLSRLRQHRRHAAEAGIGVALADADAVRADVALQAAEAFHMLREQRRMLAVRSRQLDLADQLIAITERRLASAVGSQGDVLRAEVERARLAGEQRVTRAEARAARAMLNGALGRPATAPVPRLAPPVAAPSPSLEAIEQALARQPELARMDAEVSRADAEVKVMRAMGRPMGLVRIGEASTMAEGRGAMLMLGVSVPLGRQRVRAGVAEAHAMQAMAEAERDAMQRMVLAEAVAAHEQLAAAHARRDAYRDDILPRARRAVDPALAAYASGDGSLLLVIEAVQLQWRVEEELVMAEAELGRAWARMDRATGRGAAVHGAAR